MTTTTDLVKEIREIAASNPDFNYKEQEGYNGSCSYFGAGVGNLEGQCCIVGQALKNLEVDTTNLMVTESDFTTPTINKAVVDYMVDIKIARARELKWLDLVQGYQDAGFPWAEAVQSADKESPLAA